MLTIGIKLGFTGVCTQNTHALDRKKRCFLYAKISTYRGDQGHVVGFHWKPINSRRRYLPVHQQHVCTSRFRRVWQLNSKWRSKYCSIQFDNIMAGIYTLPWMTSVGIWDKILLRLLQGILHYRRMDTACNPGILDQHRGTGAKLELRAWQGIEIATPSLKVPPDTRSGCFTHL